MTKLQGLQGSKHIKAVVFDMDGTLCLPQPWMFPAMRNAIGLEDKSIDILHFIDTLPTEKEKKEAHDRIELVEAKAMKETQPQPGLVDIMRYLTKNGISKNICTRNVGAPVETFVKRFIPSELSRFDYIVTREFRPTKPQPDPLLHIASKLNIRPLEMIMVGDSFDDMKSGRSAGCFTVLLKNHVNGHLLLEHKELVDVSVEDLSEIIELIQNMNKESF
ncbi:ANM_HP_G0079310.mRNA.1.CDS.1 [Saccharomyces cerevisiae]|nr:putative haloacid dehalogenase-like hydrolase [Saccharomyces cerevisiae PE-2]CAI5000857.1 ANM_HP_G0162970.mRNA.1.CDS.1 [Saccharomyces cerevisiae]CAF1606126.1 putative haloacid dehalogenase-like hydrolase [Saccharomyces cerevisiae PE-2]CAI5022796.1 ANM_HP_G0182780.mRNA.1.CDS.1 [Saccharomyces cerevisiae]CAI5225986.1 ANM_HP_G0079310.mRNA.1.CDS.1 [Saccharomyces cerevisiae]